LGTVPQCFIALVVSHIPDKGQVRVRCCGLRAYAHGGKARKASISPSVLRTAEKDLKPIPSKGCAKMILKVFYDDVMQVFSI